MTAARRARAVRETATLARVLVRGGQRTPADVVAEVRDACAHDLGAGDPDALARELVDAAVDRVTDERAAWPRPTDHDRLEAALGALSDRGVAVLRGSRDQHDAAAVLTDDAPAAGVVFFTETDVWHAVEHGMLELVCWDRDGAAAGEDDPLGRLVLDELAAQGLSAVHDEGRIEVSMYWQRRDLPCVPDATDATGNHPSDIGRAVVR